jgi:hypothetical protein
LIADRTSETIAAASEGFALAKTTLPDDLPSGTLSGDVAAMTPASLHCAEMFFFGAWHCEARKLALFFRKCSLGAGIE